MANLISTISEAVVRGAVTNVDHIYSFISKTTPFVGDEINVKDNLVYDRFIRKNIIFAKKISISDIIRVVPRYNWAFGVIYDQYDDNYFGSYVSGLNIVNGGSGYDINTAEAFITDGGGSGATVALNIVGGVIIGASVVNGGSGYTHAPQVLVVDVANTTEAIITTEISTNNLAHSGVASLKDSKFYVLTSDFNVYKCIFNNNNAASVNMPRETSVNTFTTADGYIWKFLYKIPLGLRKKFLTSSFMPVFNVLTSSYHTDGGIDYVEVTNGGSGYTTSTPLLVYVVGDGIGAEFLGNVNPALKEIGSVDVTNDGLGYYSTTTKLLASVIRTSNVATMTTDTAHNLVENIPFVISGTGIIDGSFVVSSIVNNNQFTFASTGTNISSTPFGSVAYVSMHTLAISSITRAANVVTVVTTLSHKLNKNNIITISGATGFDGTYSIAEYINPTTFTFYQHGVTASVIGSGTITQAPMGINNISRTSNLVTVVALSAHNFKAPSAIATIVRATNVATVTTVAEHVFVAGDVISISNTSGFNGSATITFVTNTFTFGFSSVGADTSETVGYVNDYIVVAGITGYNGNFAVSTIVDSHTFTFAQTDANDATYVPRKLVYNTSLALESNVGVSGKYYPNSHAIVSPNFFLKTGVDYVSTPLVKISGTTGSGATATAVVVGNRVTSINVNAVGSGYTTRPSIFFNGGGLHQAAATANLSAGIITSFTMSNNGASYTSVPEVLIVGDGSGATATATMNGGEVTSINVVTGGTGYTTATVYVTGSSDLCCGAHPVLYNNTVESIEIDSIIDTVSIIDPGTGYDDGILTTISVSGDGEGLDLRPIIRDGVIRGVYVSNRGQGYSFADLTVTGDGAGAVLSAVVSPTHTLGQVDTLQYNVEALAIAGAIDNVVMIDGGAGYTTATVTITGDGTGATANAVISSGVITKILIDASGKNYTSATVTITGDGVGASARAIIPPFGGHGSNAYKELFGDSAIMRTNISNSDFYDSFGFSNVFYQYGIIFNPMDYNSQIPSNLSIISPCPSVFGTYTLSDFPLNDTVKIIVDGANREFLIADSLSTKLLLLPLDNYLPIVGDVVTNISNNISFTVTEVGLPTFNIESGDITDVNNSSSSFYKTPTQIISLRSILSL